MNTHTRGDTRSRASAHRAHWRHPGRGPWAYWKEREQERDEERERERGRKREREIEREG